MEKPLLILGLEDNSLDSELILAQLRGHWPNCQMEVARNGGEFEAAFVNRHFHLILADYTIPGYGGAEALAFVRGRDQLIPFILITGTLGEERAIEMLRSGATDCIRKEHLARLIPIVRRALKEAAERVKLEATEEALRQAELEYRTLFERSPDGIVVLDPLTTLPIEFNDAACRQLGVSREEFGRLHAVDYVVDLTEAEIEARFAEVLRNRSAEFNAKHRRKDGVIVETWVTVQTIELSGREVFYTIWRDVSERARATAELQRREEYFRALTERGSDLVAVIAVNGSFRYLSPSVMRVLGFAPEALISTNAFDLLHPEDELIARDSLAHLISDANWGPEIELRLRHRDGSWRILEVVGRNLLDDPSLAGVILNARDVTERKEAQMQIREQAALLDKAQDAIMVCDLESRILFWNRSAERFYGWTAQEALGRSADELLFARQAVRPLPAFKGLIAKGEWHGELVQTRRNGEQLVVESRWSLVRTDASGQGTILIINTDVTETRKLQAQFLRAQRMESIGALAGGIAHDLNNVLSPVLMAAELLREKITDPDCQQWLDTLSDSARRGAELVRQILSFARGTGEQFVELQLRHLIAEHERILREILPRSIKIESNVERGLWLVHGNATKLSQVLMNLSVNARDAMPAGGCIRIRARNLVVDKLVSAGRPDLQSGSCVVISVADTGTGIPRDLLGRIFEPFFTTKDVTKGTGLGLATAQGIVKSHGGLLTVYSEEGKGTQFHIYLPAVQTEAALQVALRKPPLRRGSGECVLVVDDEAPTRELIEATLQMHGYEVLLAKDGSDGLGVFLANRDRVKLVVTDVDMPIMDGPSLIRALRGHNPDLRILTLSGLIDPRTGNFSQGTLGIEILEKPCTAEELLSGVYKALATFHT